MLLSFDSTCTINQWYSVCVNAFSTPSSHSYPSAVHVVGVYRLKSIAVINSAPDMFAAAMLEIRRENVFAAHYFSWAQEVMEKAQELIKVRSSRRVLCLNFKYWY